MPRCLRYAAVADAWPIPVAMFVIYPYLKRWYLEIAARPGVQRGYHVPKEVTPIPLPA